MIGFFGHHKAGVHLSKPAKKSFLLFSPIEWHAAQEFFEREGGPMFASYQLVEQTVLLQGQTLSGPVQRATIQIFSSANIGFDGKEFR